MAVTGTFLVNLSSSVNKSTITQVKSKTTASLNGEEVYAVLTQKEFRVLGLKTVVLPIKEYVSTETGILVAEEKSFITKILSSLSF